MDNIPEEITQEVREYILQDGACGEVEFVEQLEEGTQEQKSDLSFCQIEYAKQEIGTGENMATGVLFFPYSNGFLKVGYAV